MTLTEIEAEIKSVALAVDGVQSFKTDWVHVINDDNANEYDLFLLTPPTKKTKLGQSDNYNDWKLNFYIFRQNKVGDRTATPEERVTMWSDLLAMADEFGRELVSVDRNMEDHGTNRIVSISGLLTDTNAEDLGNDDLVWITGRMEIRTFNEC